MDKKLFGIVRSNIDRYGVHLAAVGAGEGEPSFTYTVGLQRYDHPELILFRGRPQVAGYVLNRLAFRIRDGAQRFEQPVVIRNFSDERAARLHPVEDSSHHLTVANRMYRAAGRAPVPALQILIQGTDLDWPWTPGSRQAGDPNLAPVDFDVRGELPEVDLVMTQEHT